MLFLAKLHWIFLVSLLNTFVFLFSVILVSIEAESSTLVLPSLVLFSQEHVKIAKIGGTTQKKDSK